MRKQDLEEYRVLSAEIRDLEREIITLRQKASSRAWPDGQPGGGRRGDKVASLATSIADMAELLEGKRADLLRRRQEIEAAIEALPPVYRRLIRLRYVEGLKWEKICVTMGYSWKQTHRLHGKALREIGRDDTK